MFALTLNFYSPRAYKYIREKFCNHLPHKSTLKKWYANSSASDEPGLCEQSIDILSGKVKELKAAGIQPICSLIFDEMAIKKHLQWSKSKKMFLGQITYGFRPENLALPIANNALVFMLNGINFDMTLPISYYFINSLKTHEKVVLLTKTITTVIKCGVRVLSVTFDGLATNFTMCESLGASFDINNLKPYFVLPGNDCKIYVILDPSHVLKLARNTIGNNKVLVDADNSKIKWKYFEDLETMRIEKDFAHVHKLTKMHIQYGNHKMKVRIASETLSNSVAISMQYLQDKGHAKFSNSSATIKFVRFINHGFDIMNTKGYENMETCNISNNVFKNAINPQNKEEIFAFLHELVDYLKQIKFKNGELVINSKTRTAFRGLIINASNFESIYEECVESSLINFLPTFRFSQDHLESFFGRIRSLPGCNDNPTVEQFGAGFKKIVVCNEIQCSEGSNCLDKLNLTVLSVSSSSSRKIENAVVNPDTTNLKILHDENLHDSEDIERLDIIKAKYKSSDALKMSIAYIAGKIEQQIELSGRFECGDCYDLFADNDKVSEAIASELTRTPCQSTFDICNIAHKYIQNLSRDYNYTYEIAKSDIFREFDEETAYPKTNFEGHELHRGYFIEFVVTHYMNIQATYIAKRVTLKEQTIMLRNKLRKIVHFRGM